MTPIPMDRIAVDIPGLGTTQLPAAYAAFLRSLIEDDLFGDRVLLYSCEQLAERNDTYESAKYCPGYLAIGDDSGGRAFVMHLESGRIGVVDHGAMTPDCITEIAIDFASWQRDGFRSPVGAA